MTNALRSIRSGPEVPERVLVLLPGYGDSPEPFLDRAGAFDPARQWLTVVVEPRLRNDRGPYWYDVDENGPDPIELAASIAAVDAFCASMLSEYRLDPQHLVVAGFSQGGALALAHLLDPSSTITPRALAALSSYLPSRDAHLIDITRASNHPMLLAHGEDDELVDPIRGRSAAKALHRAGALVTWSEVRGGHRFDAPIIDEFAPWLAAVGREESPVSPPI